MTGAIALVLSGLAVILSAGALVFNVRSRKRDLFLTMHERLLDDDIRRGRRDLFASSIDSLDAARSFRDARPDEFERICRALAMLDVLGCYVYRRYVKKTSVLEEWGHTYGQMWLKGQHIVRLRLKDEQGLWSAWPHFQRFGDESLNWALTQPRGMRSEEARHASPGVDR